MMGQKFRSISLKVEGGELGGNTNGVGRAAGGIEYLSDDWV